MPAANDTVIVTGGATLTVNGATGVDICATLTLGQSTGTTGTGNITFASSTETLSAGNITLGASATGMTFLDSEIPALIPGGGPDALIFTCVGIPANTSKAAGRPGEPRMTSSARHVSAGDHVANRGGTRRATLELRILRRLAWFCG